MFKQKTILILCIIFFQFLAHASIDNEKKLTHNEAAYLVTSGIEATKALFADKNILDSVENKFNQEEKFIEACKKEREIVEKITQQPIDQQVFEEQIKKRLEEKKLFQDCDLNKGLEALLFKNLKTEQSQWQARSACFSPAVDYDASYTIVNQRVRLAELLIKKENSELIAPLLHELSTIEKQLQENEKESVEFLKRQKAISLMGAEKSIDSSQLSYAIAPTLKYITSQNDKREKSVVNSIATGIWRYIKLYVVAGEALFFYFRKDPIDVNLKYATHSVAGIILAELLYDIYGGIKSTKKAINYFSLINKKLELTQQLSIAIKDICKNDSGLLEAFPEYKFIEKSFESPEKYFYKNSIASIAKDTKSYVFPGLLSHFYFNKLEAALPTITSTVNRFISSVDLSCAAGKLATEQSSEYSIPALIKSIPATPYTLNLEEFAHPKLASPVKNSLDLKENKFLVSPTGSGKTLAITSIMANLLMGNSGVWRVANGRGVYCNNFKMSLNPEYEVGDRASRYMTELSDTHNTIESLKAVKEPALLLSDEPLHSSQEKAAAIMLVKNLKALSGNQHVKSIVATHNIPATNLAENKDANTGIIFTEVTWDADGYPTNTYKLKSDDLGKSSENWWRNDFEKVVKYENALEKQAITIAAEKKDAKEAILNAMLRSAKKETK